MDSVACDAGGATVEGQPWNSDRTCAMCGGIVR